MSAAAIQVHSDPVNAPRNARARHAPGKRPGAILEDAHVPSALSTEPEQSRLDDQDREVEIDNAAGLKQILLGQTSARLPRRCNEPEKMRHVLEEDLDVRQRIGAHQFLVHIGLPRQPLGLQQ